MRILGFGQKSNPFICAFNIWICKGNDYLTFCKNHVSKNCGPYGPETSRPIRLPKYLICIDPLTNYLYLKNEPIVGKGVHTPPFLDQPPPFLRFPISRNSRCPHLL